MSAVAAFLLAFPALFSIVNPVGMAFIFEDMVGALPRADRARIARNVGVYSFAIMAGALWFGAAVMHFFGVSIEALRVAGGLVVVLTSLELLLASDRRETRKQEQAAGSERAAQDMAFFPLTMPLTTGPGTIAVAIALGAARPESGRVGFIAGVTLAAAALALLVWLIYWSADRMATLLSQQAQRIISRMSAFLLLCIGVQIMITGLGGVVADIAANLHKDPNPTLMSPAATSEQVR